MPETAETGLIVRHPAALTAAAPSSDAAVGTAARPPGRRRRNRHWYRLVSPVAVVGLWQGGRGAGGRSAPTPCPHWYRLVSRVAVVGLWQAASSAGILPASKLVSPASIAVLLAA